MRTLSSELGAQVARTTLVPRVYADANLPAGLVAFMRVTLGWDVFFVMEHDDLRRAADLRHYRLAREMHRTLISLDRDYMDDRRFPPQESGGVIVLSAPDRPRFEVLLRRVDRHLVRPAPSGPDAVPASVGAADASAPASFDMPLAGRKIHAHPDWP